MAKVLAINGSPNAQGNTAQLLAAILAECTAAGHDTEVYQAGGRAVRGCLGCGACWDTPGKCVQDDWVNELYGKMKAADAILIGSPTYFADVTAEIKAVIDRVGFVSRADGHTMARKIGAAVCAVRRAGAIHVFDTINHFFLINEMVVPGSSYWNLGIGLEPGDVQEDAEGLQTMKRLGENLNWLLGKLS
ncbi:MAG: flavodoxin family protein [Oscillospiraceae bacterium]|jgi:multimeric flavodoxin WrbA|nr:flavodoxin family protein [Oscillospiraceae bacterium]